MTWLWIVLGVLAVVGLVYWQLVVAEGTYLGPRVVALLYDWVAGRYDAIKQFSPRYERWFIVGPLIQSLAGVERPLILDVATGTGRVPWALLHNRSPADAGPDWDAAGQPNLQSQHRSGFLGVGSVGQRFPGQIIGLDLSLGMLRQAGAKLSPYRDQVSLVWQGVSSLPFDAGSFDVVTCLESLEFFPHPQASLAEMIRVLAPGGILLITNRVGREARLLPGRAIPRSEFSETLSTYSLESVESRPWQECYDLAIARKPGQVDMEGRGGVDLESLLRCPYCGLGLEGNPAVLICRECERIYPVRRGIVEMAETKRLRKRA